MNIRIAVSSDIKVLSENDKHISNLELENSIHLNRIYIMEDNNTFVGWLRYNLFWDNTPFMNMLFLLDEYRGKGLGKEFVLFWEKKMKNLGYESVMTSTASDEYAQHFYNKLRYITIGGFISKGDPYELILEKAI